MKILPLSSLPVGCRAKVNQIDVCGAIRRRLMDLGLIVGTEIRTIRKSLSGDPVLYEIRGAMIAIRYEEASKIWVEVSL